ncbi:hypothetical protein IJC60_03200 [bacterium]|nr:hypothetical protein [bacterium]
MKKVFLFVFVLGVALIFSGCKKKYETAAEFYEYSKKLREKPDVAFVFDLQVETARGKSPYKVYTKNGQMRVETVDLASYTEYSSLFLQDTKTKVLYDPIMRTAKILSDRREMQEYNPIEFMLSWGDGDSEYIDEIFKLGKKVKRGETPCKMVHNINLNDKQNSFEFCVNEELGIATYLYIPCSTRGADGKKYDCSTRAEIFNIKQEDVPDMMFALPSDAILMGTQKQMFEYGSLKK